jgi:hypothetical protein
VFSDIHIELWDKIPNIPVKEKYLFLAGDICNITHPLFYPFLDYCSTNWVKTFYVPGNHEYYIKKRLTMKYYMSINIKLERDTRMYILTWISGHTHWSYDFTQNNVRHIGNQIGYKSEVGKTGLIEDGVFVITIS